jgi:hypothetical protein
MMLMQLHIIRFVSEARLSKPETVVFAEQYGIRELSPSELIHLHEEGKTTCVVCGRRGFMAWTDSKDKFQQHPRRCGNLPAIEVDLS